MKSFLPDKDYLPLALPSSDMDVLWVLTRAGGDVRRFGLLADVLTAGSPPGEDLVRRKAVVVDATGGGNWSAEFGLTLGVVNTILTALGGKAGVNLSATGASKVSYSYTDVQADTVDLVRLDNWLTTADLGATAPRVADLLVAERIYVVVGALRATGIAVTLLDNADRALDLDVPTIEQLVGGGLDVTSATGRSGTVVFHGARPLTVAAKVAQLKMDERGFWVSEEPLDDGEIRTLAGRPSPEPEYLGGDELSLA